jgi:hypothetical protein
VCTNTIIFTAKYYTLKSRHNKNKRMCPTFAVGFKCRTEWHEQMNHIAILALIETVLIMCVRYTVVSVVCCDKSEMICADIYAHVNVLIKKQKVP